MLLTVTAYTVMDHMAIAVATMETDGRQRSWTKLIQDMIPLHDVDARDSWELLFAAHRAIATHLREDGYPSPF
jgi:hypothetical protein